MPHAYNEDQLIEQPAIGLFAELRWTTQFTPSDLRRTRNLLLPRLLSGQVALDVSLEIQQPMGATQPA